MIINDAGRRIIQKNEGLRLLAYHCPAGVPTIGYGHTKGVEMGQEITAVQAEVMLDEDISEFEVAVERFAPKANENEFAALVSLAFNIGVEALSRSTLLRLFLAGDKAGAAAEFLKFVHVRDGKGFKVLPGLVKRRHEERALFLEPVA